MFAYIYMINSTSSVKGLHEKLLFISNALHRMQTRSSEVTDFGTNRKPIYDFLLINSNLPSILHRFQVTADYMQNFR